MSELTKEYFDKHYQKLNEFLVQQFEKVFAVMATKEDLANTEKRIRADMATKQDIAELKLDIEGLRNSVNNYLRLSDERYLELKHRQDVIVSWIMELAEHSKLKLDTSKLEYK